jgi:hypothetical protein
MHRPIKRKHSYFMRMIIINSTCGVSAKPCQASDDVRIVSLVLDLCVSMISQIETASDLSRLRRSQQTCPCYATMKDIAEYGSKSFEFSNQLLRR